MIPHRTFYHPSRNRERHLLVRYQHSKYEFEDCRIEEVKRRLLGGEFKLDIADGFRRLRSNVCKRIEWFGAVRHYR